MIETEIVTERKKINKRKLEPPKKYAVYILNDDYTPWDFVITILIKIFNKSQKEAEELTFFVHENGKGLCGVYSKEIAETKMNVANEFSKLNKQPLRTIIKPYDEK
jgi:ATP-dependent Clp protease adaptor protein ClpS